MHPAYENDFKSPNLKQILHHYVEESVTDEQVQKILKPILKKIDAGEFEKPKTSSPDVSQNELIRQSYKFQLASPHLFEASLDIIWKGAELHIRIEYK